MLAIVSIYIACYLIGSINFSLIASGLLLRKDLRQIGSGNAGATNLFRLGSRKIALAVLLLDIGRSILVMWGCARIPIAVLWPFVALPLLLGNLFPIFHGFKGGKGIAMSMGIVLAVCPVAGIAGIAAMLSMIAIWRKVSIGSLSFMVSATVASLVLATPSITLLFAIMTTSAIVTHRENISRIYSGQEPNLFSRRTPR